MVIGLRRLHRPSRGDGGGNSIIGLATPSPFKRSASFLTDGEDKAVTWILKRPSEPQVRERDRGFRLTRSGRCTWGSSSTESCCGPTQSSLYPVKPRVACSDCCSLHEENEN
ncbi:hypothetical protein JZ751_013143 [Albula glossodonta]|uniref:Uncharacterized protein n=1 Tax=Albula glossodonta TaxID=121402 RepID=A0A8T2P2A4_9TELE|nr:hypothetical protein JZ751_013143 [Albula glossodonta]